MNEIPGNVKQYFQKHVSKNYKLEWNYCKGIKNIVVVPAISEYENIPFLIKSLSENDPEYFPSTLIIFIINHTASSKEEVKENNIRTIKLLRNAIIKGKTEDPLINTAVEKGLKFGLIDAASKGKEFDDKTGGVGLARKTAMDAALNVFDYNLPGKNIILSTDADCTVSDNYLQEVISKFNNENLFAAHTAFEHKLNSSCENNQAAIISYEIFLRYYVIQLKLAGSHYAFHTIGSTIVCDSDAYIRTGGMNKRKAAEDFYFLEKLAKNFPVVRIKNATVYPSGRTSWRVPFGTGKRMLSFIKHTQNNYLLANPISFDLLKTWLKLFDDFSENDTDKLLSMAKNIHIELYNFLLNQGFKNDWTNVIKNSKSEKQLALQKKIWFDGFRTLKLIHHFRDTAFPDINMFDALEILFDKTKTDFNPERKAGQIPDVKIQKEYLLQLRKLEEKLF